SLILPDRRNVLRIAWMSPFIPRLLLQFTTRFQRRSGRGSLPIEETAAQRWAGARSVVPGLSQNGVHPRPKRTTLTSLFFGVKVIWLICSADCLQLSATFARASCHSSSRFASSVFCFADSVPGGVVRRTGLPRRNCCQRSAHGAFASTGSSAGTD